MQRDDFFSVHQLEPCGQDKLSTPWLPPPLKATGRGKFSQVTPYNNGYGLLYEVVVPDQGKGFINFDVGRGNRLYMA